MDCSLSSLIEASKCYRCIPGPVMQASMISLLCQWANNLTPPIGPFRWEPQSENVYWEDAAHPLGAFTDYPTFQTIADPTTVTVINATTTAVTGFFNISSLPSLTTFTSPACPFLTSLDFSNCLNLISVTCNDCNLSSLILFNCPSLITLLCQTNSIQALDLSTATNVVTVNCSSNAVGLLGLTVTGCTSLITLTANTCNLTAIAGLNTCSSLQILRVNDNFFASLSVYSNPSLTTLECGFNLLGTLTMKLGNGITFLWTFNNPSLIVNVIP